MLRLRIGPRWISDGDIVDIEERTALKFSVISDSPPVLLLADEVVPLEEAPDGYRTARDWIDSRRTRHLVGDCPLELHAERTTLRALVRRVPSRITLEAYHYLIDMLWTRLGAHGIEDPLGRVKVWARMAPRIPSPGEERARILASLFERAAPALRSIGASPRRSLATHDEWVPIRRLRHARGRVDGRRIRRWDPPLPRDTPTRGSVLVHTPVEDVNTPENRYVVAVVSMLTSLLHETRESDDLSSDIAVEIDGILVDLASWFRALEWKDVGPGALPHHSFVLRDDPRNAAIASLAVQLHRLPGLLIEFPPDNPARLFPLSPFSLNVLYERWIQMLVFEWLTERLWAPERAFAPQGTWEWATGTGRTVLRIDVPYPSRGSAGIIVPVGKNRPDVAIEVWRGSRVDVLTLDATYSQAPGLHNEKLTYAANLKNAATVNDLTGDNPLVVRWAAYAWPAGKPSVLELGASLSRASLSLPPGDESVMLLRRYLDATVGEALDG